MDGLEGIKHDVAFKTLNVRHLVDFSPVAVTVSREIRYCVITIAVCITTVTLIRALGTRSEKAGR